MNFPFSSRRRIAVSVAFLGLMASSQARAATLTVDSTADNVAEDGVLTLREAVNAFVEGAANADVFSHLSGEFAFPAPNEIRFDSSVFAGKRTIKLTGGKLAFRDQNVNIVGPISPGAGLTIEGVRTNPRVLFLVESGSVALSHLNMSDYTTGVFVRGGTVLVENCALIGLTSDNSDSTGLDSYRFGATSTLRNCTITGNSSYGVDAAQGNVTIDSCTIVDNKSGVSASYDWTIYSRPPVLSISNSIIAGSQYSNVSGKVNDGGYNLCNTDVSRSLTASTNKLNTDPGFAPGGLAYHAGTTQTLALLANSPAVDAGQTELASDQRGMPRPQGGSDDIGAFEYGNRAPLLANVSIAQSAPKTKDTLSVAVGTQSDTDGDSLTRSYQWKKNGTPIEGQTGATLDLGQAGNGDKGDKISVVVTVSDGTDSVSSESPQVTIVNSAPTVSGVRIHGSDLVGFPKTLDFLYVFATTSDDDGDQVSLGYQWFKNGQKLTTAIANPNPLLLSQPGNGDHGDVIFAKVTASDRTDETSVDTAPLTVLNTPPTKFWIHLITSGGDGSFTNMVLTADLSLDGSQNADDDNDSLTTTYVWKKNGVVLEGEMGASLDLSKPGNGDKNDTISVTVTRTDGLSEPQVREASTKITDSYPVPKAVKISPIAPKTNDVLRANVTGTDADGDTPAYWFTWTRNGERLSTDNSGILDLGQLNGETTNGDKGDVIAVTVKQMFGPDSNISDSVKVLNSAPTLTPATFEGTENTPLSGKIVAQDADGDAFTLSVARTTGRGKLELAGDGTFTYSPLANFNGTDSFIVRATDSEGALSTATYTITVAATNGAPVPAKDVVSGYEDVPLVIPAATLLRNDSNGELRGEADALKIVRVTTPAGFPGVLRLDVARQTITFTPTRNWSGNTLFVYTVQDSQGATASAQVDVKIAPVNDAPVAFTGRMVVVSGAVGELKLAGSDAENDVLSFALSTRPANGVANVVKVGANWVLRYQSKIGFSGTDTLAVIARDGRLNSAPATITITVKPNTAPQLVSLVPNRGTVATGTSIVFEQKVRDADGAANLDAVALVPSASATALVTRGGAALWFDAINNQFTMTKDDGKTTFPPVAVGRTLENAQMRVTLGASDVIRGANGLMALRWRITFKAPYVGVKSLWGRVEDQTGLSAGFTNLGQITVGNSGSIASNPSAAGS